MKKVIYLLNWVNQAGGVRVIFEHLTRLKDRGWDAQLWTLGGDFSWFGKDVPRRVFKNTDSLGEALREERCPKIATFYVTATWVPPNLQEGEIGYYFIQDEDQSVYGGDNSGSTYKLGLMPITEGNSVSELIESKYGTSCVNVGIAVDHSVFYELPFIRERWRVLCSARNQNGLKGWQRTEEILRELAKVEPKASVVTFGGEFAPKITFVPHIHLGFVSDAKLRELYSQSGVFLQTSVREGFGLMHLEALACGIPLVCTNAWGNMEFCSDGENCAIISEPVLAAKTIADIMNDDKKAKKMSRNGKETAARYQWDDVIDRLEYIWRHQ